MDGIPQSRENRKLAIVATHIDSEIRHKQKEIANLEGEVSALYATLSFIRNVAQVADKKGESTDEN
jgi:hypothetical protein